MGNEKYEGFCVDVLNALAEQFGFKFQIFAASEKYNGRKSTTNWPSEALVGELIRGVGTVIFTHVSVLMLLPL